VVPVLTDRTLSTDTHADRLTDRQTDSKKWVNGADTAILERKHAAL